MVENEAFCLPTLQNLLDHINFCKFACLSSSLMVYMQQLRDATGKGEWFFREFDQAFVCFLCLL